MKNILLILSLVAWYVSPALAGHDEVSCRNQVLKACASINSMAAGGKTVLLDYKLTAHFKTPDSDNIETVEVVYNMILKGDELLVKTQEMVLARGLGTELLINKRHRKIFLSSSAEETSAAHIPMADLREEMLNNSKETACKTVGKGTVRLITLQVPGEYGEKYKVRRLTFSIDTASNKLLGFTVEHTPGEVMQKQTVEILKLEKLPASSVALKSPSELVFGRNKQLLPEYKGFELLDNRKNKRPMPVSPF